MCLWTCPTCVPAYADADGRSRARVCACACGYGDGTKITVPDLRGHGAQEGVCTANSNTTRYYRAILAMDGPYSEQTASDDMVAARTSMHHTGLDALLHVLPLD